MTAKNFSPGDVVVCINNGPRADSPSPAPALVVRRLYTVVSTCIAPPTNLRPGTPLVHLAEVGARWPNGDGFGSDRFRLAYTPDPEVEREADRIDCDKVRALIESGRRELKRIHGQ